MNAEAEPQAPPSARRLIWLFIRWAPSVLLVSLSTLWALVLLGGIAKVIGWLLLMTVAPGFALLIAALVLLYAIVRRRISRPMIVAFVLAAFVAWPLLWQRGILAVPYPASVDDQPAARVHVPVEGDMVVYWGGPKLEQNYHALYPDQRFAYDLIILPRGGSQLQDYGCFGAPVIAPAKGKIVVAHDGEPDVKPGAIVETPSPMGNHIALELSTGTYLLIAHLKKGSIVVKAGDQVELGQKIADCGNSGRTSEPHIHIHHQKQDPRVHGAGLAEGLPLFFLTSTDPQGQRMPTGGVLREGETLKLLGDTISPLR